MASNGDGARSSRMEAELHKRKLEALRHEREKLQQQLIKESEAAFKGALLSNVKALEQMNKSLGALGGAVSSGKKVTAKSMTINHAKVMAKNTEMMVKHAVTQVNLLKSIDKSLLNVASLLKPQFKVFERNLDALTVKVMDKTPVRVYQTMQDPKRSGFKKALDAIFGSQAPKQEVYVSNWKEIREGVAKTRTDLLGRVGQLLSTGIIGKITGLGKDFARGARYETTSMQHNRIMTEMRQGGDPAKILAREKASTKMSEIEKLYAGARGNAATFNMASVFALSSEKGREELTEIFKEMFTKSYNDSLNALKTSFKSNAVGLYGGIGSKLKPEFDQLRSVARVNTGYSGYDIPSKGPLPGLGGTDNSNSFSGFSGFAKKAKSQVNNGANSIKAAAAAFAEATVDKTSKLKQSGGAFIDSTSEAIKYGIESIKEIFGKMFNTAYIKLMTKALFIVVRTGKTISKIKNNTDEMLKLMKLGAKGGTPSQKEAKKGIFGKLRERFKNRKSFRVTEKRKGTGALLGGTGKLLGGLARLKVATISGLIGGLGSLFGKGSFKMSGVSAGKTGMVAKAALAPVKGAAFIGKKGISGVRGLFGSLFGGDSFKLRRSKEAKEERVARRGGFLSRMFGGDKDKLLFKIYKLLLKRLPTKRMWKRLSKGGSGSSFGKFLGGIIKNPATLLGVVAAASIASGVNALKNADISGNASLEAMMRNAKQKQIGIEATRRADATSRSKFGISVSDFKTANKLRKNKGMTTVGSLPIMQELKKMGYSLQDDIPQEAINKATAAANKSKQKDNVMAKNIIKKAELKDVINIKNPPIGQTVTPVPTEQKIVAHQAKTDINTQQEKMMKFLIGEFTNNLVMSLQKSGGKNASGGVTPRGAAPGLNVFK